MYRDPLAGPIPRSDDALLPAANRNADSIASSALTKCVSRKAKSVPDDDREAWQRLTVRARVAVCRTITGYADYVVGAT